MTDMELYRIIRVNSLLFDHFPVCCALDISRGFLGVTTNTDMETTGTFCDEGDEVQEGNLNEGPGRPLRRRGRKTENEALRIYTH